MKPIPTELTTGPFLRSRAVALGVTPQMLRGRRFVRVHPRVFRVTELEVTREHELSAARLALPARAHLTGISRLQRLGLDYGQTRPLRFVIEGDHHLALDGIFLHRTKLLPPYDDDGVCVAAAFISYCSLARVIDAIKVGDWLLHHDFLTMAELVELASSQLWRAGAQEALFVSNFLVANSWSLKESETRAVLQFAGLPPAQPNLELQLGARTVIGDLVYEEWKVVVEYEGDHHQEDRRQYNSDIDRYEVFRGTDYRYVQITKERLAKPRRAVRQVDAELRRAGYLGPAPVFGETWRSLFVRVSRLVGRSATFESAA